MGKLLDISLKGVLVSRPQAWPETHEGNLMLEVHPPGNPYTIRMEVEPVHTESDHLGFICQHIDLDSVSHLRRLIELNVGDDEILHRELGDLVHD